MKEARPSWRDIPDEVILANSTSNIFSRAESLCPGPSLIESALNDSPEAIAIVDAWCFKFPVTRMSRSELAALSDRCHVVFTAQECEVSR